MRGPIPSRWVHRRRASPGARSTKPIGAVVPVKFGADQHASAEAQLLQVEADLLEVPVVQVALQRGEQRPHPVGAEFPAWSSAIFRSCLRRAT